MSECQNCSPWYSCDECNQKFAERQSMTSHDNVTDIVERLRSYPAGDGDTLAAGYVCMMMEEAAEEIISLRKQLENARDALRGAAKAIEQGNLYETMCCSGQDCGCRGSSHADLALHHINEALKGQPC